MRSKRETLRGRVCARPAVLVSAVVVGLVLAGTAAGSAAAAGKPATVASKKAKIAQVRARDGDAL
ncbi:MAG TPA: hypothetical protein VHV75_08010 [Solirubrobacteraceae bacterium]|nr:hypothetical protein [Solirubrobacteraceae bacterium]